MPIANKVINFRASASNQALIDHAAQICGKNRTDFILDATCEKAREVLADQAHFTLTQSQLLRFNDLLEAPLSNPEGLQRLLDTPSPWER